MADEKLIEKLASDYEKFKKIYTSETKAWHATLNQFSDLKNASAEKKKSLLFEVNNLISKEKADTLLEKTGAEKKSASFDQDAEEKVERAKNWQREQIEKQRQENFKRFQDNPGTEVQPPLFPLR